MFEPLCCDSSYQRYAGELNRRQGVSGTRKGGQIIFEDTSASSIDSEGHCRQLEYADEKAI
ncbi:hypothetical protein [Pseudomonas sp. NBRC 111119]|uniref:hypothetical protein n=1 Tax=Pseudomonas sp. NBRC 111119 TaxID=1661034 RepID=UPI000AA3CE35|nr:hypothetical protein [Pseudomonas sp. NBRC 111119]